MAKVELMHAESVIKDTPLHLMPFHVAYDGPAPMKTFFRPKPVTEAFPGQNADFEPMDTHTPDKEESGSQEIATNEASQDLMNVDSLPVPSLSDETDKTPLGTTTPTRAEVDSRRLTTSFRGRVMQGLHVDLPTGYSGVVLCNPSTSSQPSTASTSKTPALSNTKTSNERKKKEKAAAVKAAKSQRAARRAKRSGAVVEVNEPVPDPEEEQKDGPDQVAVEDLESTLQQNEGVYTPAADVKLLRPTATFNSFVLWHPDIAVDVGKDEYLRTLNEWVGLAAEIHKY